ncbi:serine/threonine protein kinase [Methylomonas methanica]|uniref:Serine/threonine protein kinase n=1 Tax=Methylomonas methanica (strain DSM 25384 / MC09) TaxID=857087 RepID=F9ZUZ7_METMM|nr:serine/threonine-protein kinase [Methylomonas methanica]AEF99430.1 serine/threonine protein kinase [Methylomonas methanica MC09]
MSDTFCPACLSSLSNLSVCPQCGWYPGIGSDALYLPPGTVVNPPYQVARVLGHGGFGITYLGWDANLQIKVAIKEYMPREFASRDPQSGQVLAKAGEAKVQFSAGLSRFLDEARTLAKFQQHPGIVSVLSFFPAFGTGYMVMEYVEGQTLKGYLDQRGRLNWTQTLDIFMQIMDALRAVHKAGLLHRDIAPDNIYLCGDGRVKLLDFGAAQTRLVGNGQTGRAQTVLVKSGFAPEEQYLDDGRQGPWTDVYSLAASMYFCLAGQAPQDALDRLKQDSLKPLSDYGVTIPPQAELVLRDALAVSSLQRPQSIDALQKRFLDLQLKPATAQPPAIKFTDCARTTSKLSVPANSGPSTGQVWRRWPLVGGGVLILFLIVLLWGRGERKQNSNGGDSFPTDAAPGEPIQPDLSLQPDDTKLNLQRITERQAAEALKRQQEAALQRFEERRRQETAASAPSVKTTDSQHSEHLHSICAEWGATMECQELRKNQ